MSLRMRSRPSAPRYVIDSTSLRAKLRSTAAFHSYVRGREWCGWITAMNEAGGLVLKGGGAAAAAVSGNDVPDMEAPCAYGKAIIALLMSAYPRSEKMPA